jgi:putative hydrolase of the HAD superfamily
VFGRSVRDAQLGEAVQHVVGLELAGERDDEAWAARFFGHELWLRLNRGHFTEAEAQILFVRELGMSPSQVSAVFHHVKDTQILVPGTLEIVQRLYRAGHPLYGTNNVHEIVAYLRKLYDVWKYFRGVVVSAEVDLLKPEPAIYRRLLSDYGLEAERSVFIDDIPGNVDGARDVGMHAIHFIDAVQCERDLLHLGLRSKFNLRRAAIRSPFCCLKDGNEPLPIPNV